MPVYSNVFNFSAATKTGFNTTIQVLDNLKNPANITDFSASMTLNVQDTPNVEFNWSTSDFISKSGPGNFVITVPTANLMPKTFISVPEQYSYQVYDYQFTVLDSNNQNYFTLTGLFTIYIT